LSTAPQIRSAYRGRLAPSPTGLLHLGHARTFSIAAERARAAGGALILRIEDLDPERSRSEFAGALIEDLRWLGLGWEEGPHVDPPGPHRPYLQSKRRSLYLAAWRRLVELGCVYPCRCSRRELRQSAGARVESPGEPVGDAAGDDEPLYPGTCRPPASATPPLPATLCRLVPPTPAGVNWRFRVPDGERVCFEDGAYGRRCYVAGRDFGDFLVWRRDDVPAYQLAVVIDDAAMGITEVVRGADLLRSTARQLLLYRALGHAAPAWFHCPLVTDSDGHRLAKRADSLSIRALRARGLSPATVLAPAGRSPEQETALPPLH
jgi:glutamyl-tRNA synthetase